MQALTQGEREVRADPAAAARAVIAANPSLPRKLQLESIKQTLPATEAGAKPASPTAGRARRRGRRSAAGCSPTSCSRTTPTRRLPAVHERVPARAGDLAAAPARRLRRPATSAPYCATARATSGLAGRDRLRRASPSPASTGSSAQTHSASTAGS